MRRFLVRLFWVTAVLTGVTALGLYFGGSWFLAKATRAAIPEIIASYGKNFGELKRITFDDVQAMPSTRARWRNVTVEALPPPTARHPAPPPIRIRIASLTARLARTSPLRVDLRLDGIRVDSGLHINAPEDVPFGGDEFDVPLERIDAGSAALADVMIGGGLRSRMKEEIAAMIAFLREGSTPREADLAARLHFRLHHVPMSVRLETQQRGGVTWLRINRADLDTLSQRYDRPLTPSERDLIAENPLKAPVLLRIKEYCERSARLLSARDHAYNEDSTRHVLWSYWLTRTFGATFAEKVTEAHEVGSNNTPQESARDRANNTLGRDFADTKKTEGQVVHLAKADPRVVK